jgi:tetratricopeptide (TPR) repeat protein
VANATIWLPHARTGLKFFKRSFVLVALLVSYGLHAQDYVYDRKVFAFLPEWCKYTAYYYSAVPHERGESEARRENERLNRLMGPQNFRHLHHYCKGLFVVALARYFETSKIRRDRLLRNSIAEFDYVLNRVEPTFALLPEILTKKGESLAGLGLPGAVEPLHRALQAKPDYWPAYAALSDYFRDTGQIEQARQWLEKGLAAAPNAKPLQRRLAEFDKNAGKQGGR